MQIELKDIIKPKFAKGKTVYVRVSGGAVKKCVVKYWEVLVNSEKPVSVSYFVGDPSWYEEQRVFATAEEAFEANV